MCTSIRSDLKDEFFPVVKVEKRQSIQENQTVQMNNADFNEMFSSFLMFIHI